MPARPGGAQRAAVRLEVLPQAFGGLEDVGAEVLRQDAIYWFVAHRSHIPLPERQPANLIRVETVRES